MKKYTDVDIIAELQKLVDSHVDSFKEDFDIDKRIIRRAAESQNPEDKTLMWFCRPHGTHCLNENQVFIQGTRDHNTFRLAFNLINTRFVHAIGFGQRHCQHRVTGCLLYTSNRRAILHRGVRPFIFHFMRSIQRQIDVSFARRRHFAQ